MQFFQIFIATKTCPRYHTSLSHRLLSSNALSFIVFVIKPLPLTLAKMQSTCCTDKAQYFFYFLHNVNAVVLVFGILQCFDQ